LISYDFAKELFMTHRLLSFRFAMTLLSAMVLGCLQSHGVDAELTRQDIDKIKTVCRSLIGVEAWGVKEVFRVQLMPYVRSKRALEESSIVECSLHCGGTLKLRDEADVYYGFSNQPPNGAHRVDTVALHIHGKRVLAIGPGTEYYPYPYYEAENKKQ
jgi:hypothetical protein